MLEFQKRRVQLAVAVVGILLLAMTAEKFRELVGEESASKSGQFTFLNCFDMGSGSVACGVKEGVKLYVYSIRSAHVDKIRIRAMEVALEEAISGGVNPSVAAKEAQKAGEKAAKRATREAKRITGPILSSGWDFFEAVYYGGSMTEGFLRGTGTLFGTYIIGYHGEQALGKVGYLTGSHLGSWLGGRIGLMIYDIINGVNYLFQSTQREENANVDSFQDNQDSNGDAEYNIQEKPDYETHVDGGQSEHVHYDDQNEETQQDNPEGSGGWGFF